VDVADVWQHWQIFLGFLGGKDAVVYDTPHAQWVEVAVFDPDNSKVILLDHIARMLGCQQCWSIQGFRLIDASWSSQCPIDSIVPLKESMPRIAFANMYQCLHFADDFD
jgi:hypothetical protein